MVLASFSSYYCQHNHQQQQQQQNRLNASVLADVAAIRLMLQII